MHKNCFKCHRMSSALMDGWKRLLSRKKERRVHSIHVKLLCDPPDTMTIEESSRKGESNPLIGLSSDWNDILNQSMYNTSKNQNAICSTRIILLTHDHVQNLLSYKSKFYIKFITTISLNYTTRLIIHESHMYN